MGLLIRICEFIDGVPNLYRNVAADTTPDLKFVLAHGPVDAHD